MSLSTMRPKKIVLNSKYSIKNMIFTNSMKNYTIPVDTDGYKTNSCTDCGDRFICESSLKFHLNRRSVKITYYCHTCSRVKVFTNRCSLLRHIRSHVFKVTTINLANLTLEPLPREDMLFGLFHLGESATEEEVLRGSNLEASLTDVTLRSDNHGDSSTDETRSNDVIIPKLQRKIVRRRRIYYKCVDCQKTLHFGNTLSREQARAKHYMTPNSTASTCQICFFNCPNKCALKAHMRNHKFEHSCICPECGRFLNKNRSSTVLSSKHNCSGFKSIRNASYVLCSSSCELVHLQDYENHHLLKHMKRVYKCNNCNIACLSLQSLEKHIMNTHNVSGFTEEYFQCTYCPGRLVLSRYLRSHIYMHKSTLALVYPCWKCKKIFTNIDLVEKHVEACSHNLTSECKYQVKKSCSTCNKNLNYLCQYQDMSSLPSVCPKGCPGQLECLIILFENDLTNVTADTQEPVLLYQQLDTLKCSMCSIEMINDWNNIKQHFALSHKEHKCVDVQIVLEKLVLLDEDNCEMVITSCSPIKRPSDELDIYVPKHRKVSRKQKDSENITSIVCTRCDKVYETKKSFEEHLLLHRDPSSAYQCMECGSCFAVKPSFATHLFIAHCIKDVDGYVETKDCYNEGVFQNNPEPLEENQCKICRAIFETYDELDKHFRVHGMAFLMTKTQKK